MSAPRFLLYVCSFAFLAILGAIVAFTPPRLADGQEKGGRSLSPENYGLVVSAKQLDFGEVWEDNRFQWTVAIENHNRHEIRIEKLLSACTCLATEPSSLIIPAGERRTVTLTLDLTASPAASPSQSVRQFRTSFRPTIRLESGEELMLNSWEVTGKVRKVLELSRMEVDLGKHSDRRQPVPTQHVMITSFVPVHRIRAESRVAEFVIEVKQRVDNLAEHDLTITPKRNVPVGRYRFKVQLEAELTSGKKLRPREVWVHGEVAADIQALPPQVYFGANKRSTMVEECVTLHSLTGSTFKIIGQRVEADGLTLERLLEQADAAQPIFRLRQRIEHRGGQSGVAILIAERDDGSTAEIRVPVEYLGID